MASRFSIHSKQTKQNRTPCNFLFPSKKAASLHQKQKNRNFSEFDSASFRSSFFPRFSVNPPAATRIDAGKTFTPCSVEGGRCENRRCFPSCIDCWCRKSSQHPERSQHLSAFPSCPVDVLGNLYVTKTNDDDTLIRLSDALLEFLVPIP